MTLPILNSHRNKENAMTDYNKLIPSLPSDLKQIVDLLLNLGIDPAVSQKAAQIATELANGQSTKPEALAALSALHQTH